MRKVGWLMLLMFATVDPGCSCSHTGAINGKHDMSSGGGGGTGGGGGGGSGGGGDMAGWSTPSSCVQGQTLTLSVTPGTQSAAVTPGGAFTQAFTATATNSNGASADVTSQAFFSLSDPTVGTFSGNMFTWGGNHGGVITVTALECGVTGTATLTLNLSTSIGAGGVDPGSAGGQFGGAGSSNNPSCTGANAPTILYPADQTLVPPNTNVIEVHFAVGAAANNLYEISFENAVTDIKVYTACTSTTDPAQGMAVPATAANPQGCIFELSQAEWDYVARTNRNGAPITIGVRALGCDGSNVSASTTQQMSFAKEDVVGALYYWASINLAGGNPYSGGVFSYDFGVRGQSATQVLTPTTHGGGNCIGCHVVSRDGRKLLFDYDDNDGDDEYGDVGNSVFDIPSATIPGGLSNNHMPLYPPGYGTWNHGTTQFLISDGKDVAMPAGALTDRKADGTSPSTTQPTPATANRRPTSPDWAPDDSQVAFSYVPTNGTNTPPWGAGFYATEINNSDEWFAGASLYTAPWNAATHSLGAPTLVLGSAASTPPNGTAGSAFTNYYYPNFSPDGSLIAFNYAPYGANFHNPAARVQLVAAGQSGPTADDLLKLNTAATNSYTNSWPRFSPFVQSYQSGKLLWVTFSSTRPYGLRIPNNGTVNCYPTNKPSGTKTCGPSHNLDCFPNFTNTNNCSRTQIWMAAIDLDTNAVNAGTDVSHPAFWLPFQDRTTNNHLAQWAQQQFSGTCKADGDCNTAGTSGRCCFSGACAACLPPTTPTCDQAANCGPGMCCAAGSCGTCPMDGGSGGGIGGCNTCLDCNGQACNAGVCGSCKTSADCCAGLNCDPQTGQCVAPIS